MPERSRAEIGGCDQGASALAAGPVGCFRPCKKGELGGAQAGRRQPMIVELRDMPRCRALGEAIAIVRL
jgi:hypothetical protein